MKLLQEAQKAFIKFSGIQQYFSPLLSIFQRVRLGLGLVAIILFVQTSSFAQEQPWPQKKVDEYRKKAYAGDLESYDVLARHYLLLAMDNNEITTYGENMEAGLAINKGMWARSHDRLKKAYVNYWNGRYYFQARDFAYAFEQLDKSTLVTAPQNAYAHLLLGKMLDEGLGRKEENYRALTQYEMATETEIKEISRQAYFMMGRLYLNELKSAEKALANLQISFDQGFKNAEPLLTKAKEQAKEKKALLHGNPILTAQSEYYDKVREKIIDANATINEIFQNLEKLRIASSALEKREKAALLEFKKSHQDKSKPRTEFETQQEYNERITKYQQKEAGFIKIYADSMANMLQPFVEYANKRNSVKRILFAEYMPTRKLKRKYEGYLKLANTYTPELKSFETSRISSMSYDVDNELFTIRYRPKGPEKYKDCLVFVPRKEAQAFKEGQETNQYYFFLDELRAILSQGKTYEVVHEVSWHSKIHCDAFDPSFTSDNAFRRKYFDREVKTESLVNGKPYDGSIFQKKIESNEALNEYLTKASKNKKLLGRKNWKAKVVLVYSDKESRKLGQTKAFPSVRVEFLDPNYVDDDIDMILRYFHDLVHEAIEDLDVTLQTQNCQTQDTQFEFEVSFSVK